MKKKIFLTMTAILLVGSVWGCSSSDTEMQNRMAVADMAEAPMAMPEEAVYDDVAVENEMTMEESGIKVASGTDTTASIAGTDADAGAGTGEPMDGVDNVAANRKLIKNVTMSVETEEFDSLTKQIDERVTALGGYLENSSVSGKGMYSDGMRYAYFTARIPSNQLEQFVTEVEGISNVTQKDESVQDITLQYVDLESRVNTLKVEQERLMVLLGEADSIETIIALETRLTEIRYQLETMESQMRTYDNLVDYSTVYINMFEVQRLTPVETETVWQKISAGFSTSLYNLGQGLKNFFIGFVVAIPYILVWAVIIAAVIFMVRIILKKTKIRRKNRKDGADQTINQVSDQTSEQTPEQKD